jgi:hypothetical protein
MANSARDGHGARNASALAPTTYTEAGEPLEADHWLRVIKSKFGLLHCTEVQKTLFSAQQLCGDTSAWWANYAVTRPADYQVSWTEFRSAFHTHHIPAGVMRKKHQEFMDLKQGGRSVHDYSKLFNHLAQYALDQVDIDDKKKDLFMIGLSTKLQERMTLNTRGSFPEFVSNVIISDDVICAHKDAKKRKTVAALSGSAPPRYRTVYHHGPTYPPRHQHHHQCQQPQWVSHPPQRQHQHAASRVYLHHRPCHACMHHRPLEPPLAIPASTVAVRATSRESAPRPRRTLLRATSPIHHVVRRRWLLPRPVVSTTPLWKTFPRASQSSWVHFF